MPEKTTLQASQNARSLIEASLDPLVTIMAPENRDAVMNNIRVGPEPSESIVEILIVDDVKNNLLALNAILERDDVKVYQASSGTQALELMMGHDFCIAILDVQMPGMNGFELAELMRGSNKTKNIPIIFVTATAKEQNFSFKGYESGAVDFLLKPLDAHAVKSKVNIFIEFHRQQKQLKAAKEKFRGLLETAPEATVIVDKMGRIELVNAMAEKVFGFERSELINQPMEMLIPERFRHSHVRHRTDYGANPVVRQMGRGLNLYGLRKDGSEFPIDVSLSTLETEKGTLVSTVIRDISELRATEKAKEDLLISLKKTQKELEQAVQSRDRFMAAAAIGEQYELLSKNEARFRILIDTVKDYAIFLLNPQGLIETWNEGAKKLKGYEVGEIVGKHFSLFYSAEDQASGKPDQELEEVKVSGRYEDEGWRIRKDGTRFWANVVITAIRDKHGSLIGFSKITRDLSERKYAEEVLKLSNSTLEKRVLERTEQLRQAVQVAENANIAKSYFLANMSHEIRTPIGAILGFTELMKGAGNTAEQNHRYLNVVERNSQQLLRIIDDILDLSKVEAGMMTVENIQFSLAEMLADFNSLMKFKAAEKGIGFQFVVETVFPDLICSDPVRLRQVLNNIVGNAIKFTEKGHVELRIAFANDVLKFSVKDTGIGISKDQEARIFQAFAQADASTNRKFGGTGLGLILAKRLAEALGGNLSLIESRENVGSNFQIELQSTLISNATLVGVEALTIVSDAQLDLSQDNQVLSGLKLLLVEDSPDNQMLITLFLNNVGAQVSVASDGASGIELAMAEDFDVVLMDVQMPVLDGHEATKRLRTLKYTKPIIALTAHVLKEERAKCFESGFTEFLTKPVQRDLLIDVLSRYVKPMAQ